MAERAIYLSIYLCTHGDSIFAKYLPLWCPIIAIMMYIVIYSFLSYITYTYLVDRISILSSFVGLKSRYSLFLVLRNSCILRTITNSYLLVLVLTLECIYNIFAPYCSLLAGPGSSYIIYQYTTNFITIVRKKLLNLFKDEQFLLSNSKKAVP